MQHLHVDEFGNCPGPYFISTGSHPYLLDELLEQITSTILQHVDRRLFHSLQVIIEKDGEESERLEDIRSLELQTQVTGISLKNRSHATLLHLAVI